MLLKLSEMGLKGKDFVDDVKRILDIYFAETFEKIYG